MESRMQVTPSSKVVGDMAQFMVQNNLSEEEVVEKAASLSFPTSVVEYFQGYLGIPPFGFPEPLRSRVIAGKKLPNGQDCFQGRPGAEMESADFDSMHVRLTDKYGSRISERDVVSYSQYPKVFEDFMKSQIEYGDLTVLDTPTFVEGMEVGQEIAINIEQGKTLFVKLKHIGLPNDLGTRCDIS